jgi:hypothetical protein
MRTTHPMMRRLAELAILGANLVPVMHGRNRIQPEATGVGSGSRRHRKPLCQARFGSKSGGGGIRTHETPYDA